MIICSLCLVDLALNARVVRVTRRVHDIWKAVCYLLILSVNQNNENSHWNTAECFHPLQYIDKYQREIKKCETYFKRTTPWKEWMDMRPERRLISYLSASIQTQSHIENHFAPDFTGRPISNGSFQCKMQVINIHVKHTGRWHICNVQSW